MIGWLIIACEIGFWVFVLAGLFSRYILKKRKLGAFLLICTPVVDVVLLVATVIDLRNGAEASVLHSLAAIYIGVSVVYGHRMIKWADRQFYYRVSGGEKPVKEKKYGAERAQEERAGWYRHLLTWMIGGGLMGIIILMIQDPQQTEELWGTLRLWSIIIVVDFLISFSYTVFPKRENA
ncbi:hypothetical protein LCM20_16370 [Halobacillus litoralis]|uniref:hypothetical protein n=1 Tax=Halobacillus litoralis TaxID=45668 RepID=UPI001CD68F74|nr:hypothetical protein [Halobacillus litoralis]MCA0972184.1 hypothetical protein [Halobacillus litoralis]